MTTLARKPCEICGEYPHSDFCTQHDDAFERGRAQGLRDAMDMIETAYEGQLPITAIITILQNMITQRGATK